MNFSCYQYLKRAAPGERRQRVCRGAVQNSQIRGSSSNGTGNRLKDFYDVMPATLPLDLSIASTRHAPPRQAR